MLWEAYFQELPEEDFNPDNIPRWKRNSLDTSRHIFFSQNKISILDAVGSVFNDDNIGSPAWNKRYLNAYQRWVTDFPNVSHQFILISVALEMGIEQIRYHASTQIFSSPDKCYILIRECSIMSSAEIPHPLNESMNSMTGNQTDSTELTIEEITELIRGINFIGKSKWKEILENPGLKFSANRNDTSLRKCFFMLEKRLKIINFGGKYYQVLTRFEIKCIEPIPTVEQVYIENPSNRNLCSSCTYENNDRVDPPAKKIKTLRINRKQNISSDDFHHTKIQEDPKSETSEQCQKLEESIDFDKDLSYIINLCYPPEEDNDGFESYSHHTEKEVVKVNIEQILKIINDIYQDETAGLYFIKVLMRIPTILKDGWKHTWASIASNRVINKRRDTPKWNELKRRLLSMDLIEEREAHVVIRKFDLEGWESESSITIEPTPEVLNINLIDIINSIFEDNTAGPYYLKVLRKIPTSFEYGWELTWSGIAKYLLNNNRRCNK